MKTKLTALAAVLAVGLAVPGTSVADRGGVPHAGKACPAKSGKGKARGHQRHGARSNRGRNNRGRKCGHRPRG